MSPLTLATISSTVWTVAAAIPVPAARAAIRMPSKAERLRRMEVGETNTGYFITVSLTLWQEQPLDG